MFYVHSSDGKEIDYIRKNGAFARVIKPYCILDRRRMKALDDERLREYFLATQSFLLFLNVKLVTHILLYIIFLIHKYLFRVVQYMCNIFLIFAIIIINQVHILQIIRWINKLISTHFSSLLICCTFRLTTEYILQCIVNRIQ